MGTHLRQRPLLLVTVLVLVLALISVLVLVFVLMPVFVLGLGLVLVLGLVLALGLMSVLLMSLVPWTILEAAQPIALPSGSIAASAVIHDGADGRVQ